MLALNKRQIATLRLLCQEKMSPEEGQIISIKNVKDFQFFEGLAALLDAGLQQAEPETSEKN